MSEAIVGYRLSRQQQQLLEQSPGTSIFWAHVSVSLRGDVDLDLLKRALDKVVTRHEILRTRYQSVSGSQERVQVIDEDGDFRLRFIDCRKLKESEQIERMNAFRLAAQNEPLNLESALPKSAYLFQLEAGVYRLLLSLPALAADRRRLALMVAEVADCYVSCAGGEDPPDVSMQYADYAEWNRELAESEEAETGRDYWRKKNPPTPAGTKLPFRAGPETKPSPEPAGRCERSLPTELYTSLGRLAARSGSTLQACLLFGWQLLHARHGGSWDVSIGVECNPADDPQLNRALGSFARVLPQTFKLDPRMEVESALAETASALKEMPHWQDFFDFDLFDTSENSKAQVSYFPVVFACDERPRTRDVAQLQLSLEQRWAAVAPFILRLECTLGSQPSVALEYQRLHYTQNAGSELIDQYLALLGELAQIGEATHRTCLVDNLHLPCRQPLDSDQDEAGLHGEMEDFLCVHQMIEAYARSKPSAPAVIFDDGDGCHREVSFEELDCWANRIAAFLRHRGVSVEDKVGLCINRSPQMVACMVGILKAGAAYVAFDPSHPYRRLQSAMADCKAALVFGQGQSPEWFAEPETWVDVGDLDAMLTEFTSAPNPCPVHPQNLAYLLYTSGSTGSPKAVAVTHGSIANYVSAVQVKLKLPGDAVLAAFSTVAADLGHTALFGAICSGQTLLLLPEELSFEPARLAEILKRRPLDCLKIVPSHLQGLLGAHPSPALLPQACLVLGGEAPDPSLIETVRHLAPHCRILNHYGPTEATVGVLTWEWHESWRSTAATIPMGQPLNRCFTEVFDHHLSSLPVGLNGELCLGGSCLARGYLGRPRMTAEKFCPSPLPYQWGARVYRTGDRARRLPGGAFEFRGRLDDQVKIRGFRVEPGESQATLAMHPSVAQAVVLVREKNGIPQLVGYVVAQKSDTSFGQEKSKPIDAETLTRFLRRNLPDPMVPEHLIFLDKIPLTSNGKIDRNSLTNMAMPSEVRHVAPTTERERLLAEIWAVVLNVEQPGIHDNFFKLGGDSILAILVVAKAKSHGLGLTPTLLFENQTIAQLAAAASSGVVVADQGPVTGAVPLTPIQKWFVQQDFPFKDHWNQALFLEVPGNLDGAALKKALAALVNHHDALRLRLEESAGGWVQNHDETFDEPPLERVDCASFSPSDLEKITKAAIAEAQGGLSLTSGPLFRALWLDWGPDRRGRLLLVMHHWVVDGVSWRILLEDLYLAYEDSRTGRSSSLPPKTSAFKTWAEHLRNYADSEECHSHFQYWQRLTAMDPASLPVAGDGSNREGSAKTLSYSLESEETKCLLQEVPTTFGTEINHVLLTALTLAFQRITGRSQLMVAVESHGRETPFSGVDLSRTVGWFTSIYPLGLSLKPGSDPIEALRAVKEQINGVPRNGLSYGCLRYFHSGGETAKAMDQIPTPQIRFNYLGQLNNPMAESSPFTVADEPPGETRHPDQSRSYALDLGCFVSGGRLYLKWTFSPNLTRSQTIASLSQAFLDVIRELLTEAGARTSRSVPDGIADLTVNQEELDDLFEEIDGLD